MALLSSLLHLCEETPSVTGESSHHGANVTLLSCLVLVLSNQEDKTIPLLFHCILVSGLYSFSYWMNRNIEHVDMFSFAYSAQWCIYMDTSEYGINIAFNNDIFSSFFHHQAHGLNRWWLIVLTICTVNNSLYAIEIYREVTGHHQRFHGYIKKPLIYSQLLQGCPQLHSIWTWFVRCQVLMSRSSVNLRALQELVVFWMKYDKHKTPTKFHQNINSDNLFEIKLLALSKKN